MVGKTLGHYEITARLGVGGMGVVYKAYDRSLKRIVALKILSTELIANSEFKRRFLQEARAASALNHPHIVTIHEIGEADGTDFIVMEFLDGETLDKRIRDGKLPLLQSIDYALQITEALRAAHARGIVHRDLKPANIMITGYSVKVLDFGLAKVVDPEQSDATVTKSALTETGAVLGTAAYMSPEQIDGGRLDSRSDVFAFGAVLYEMVSGRRAFEGNSTLAIISSVYAAQPKPLDDVPSGLAEVVTRCLQKKPEERYQTIEEVRDSLRAIKAGFVQSISGQAGKGRKFRWIAAIAAVLLIGGLGWVWRGSRNTSWAYGQIPEVRRLVSKYDFTSALALSETIRHYIPDDPDLEQLVADSSSQGEIKSNPPGAKVALRAYAASDANWQEVGVTPLTDVRIPRGALEWRFSKDGYYENHVLTNILTDKASLNIPLTAATEVPEGMVYIPSAPRYNLTLDGLFHIIDRKVNAFYIDKFEVTNRQFKEFVDKGGYTNRELWKEPFIKDGREISRDQAMEHFHDKTGQPAPETWEFREYPAGQDDYPVTGVSWYEAAAYAEFVGKHLPPVSYWNRAARPEVAAHLILPLSNFSGKATQIVGKGAMNAFGTYDMAGNVREWCWNEAQSGQRYALGSSWNEPSYQYGAGFATDAFDRSPWNGFRLAKYSEPPEEAEMLAVKLLYSDYIHRKPASDEEYRSFVRWYQYDKTPLNAKIDLSRDERYWVREKISFDAAYDGERMIAYLFLPKNAMPPFQPVIYFPGSGAQGQKDSENRLEMDVISFLMRSGRAVIYPLYKGTYERGSGEQIVRGTMSHRDSRIQQFKDFERSIDYLETRRDIDVSKLAFYGVSWGGGMGVHFPALDARVKVNVLVHGGLRMDPALPEVDQFNFVSRVKIPTLMLSGDYDFTFPVETSQLPMLRLLGTPETDKLRISFAIGHQFLPTEFAKETIKWLDRYLGQVQTVAQAK